MLEQLPQPQACTPAVPEQMDEKPYTYVVKTDYLRAWVDEPLLLMYSEWLRPVSSQEYRDGSLALAQYLQTSGIRFWISDSSLLGELLPADQHWAINTIGALLATTAIQKIARIRSGNLASYLNVISYPDSMTSPGNPVKEMRQFYSYKEAADWIAGIKA